MSSRINVLMGHLAPFQDTEDDKQALVTGAANRAAIFNPTSAASLTTSFNSNSNPAYVQDLYRWLIRDNRELREEIFKFLKDPLYQPDYSLSLANFRELTSQRVVKFVQQRFFSVSDYINDPLRFQACLESLSFCDYSLAIKSGVHFTLCGGTIAKLGTERHHREYLPKMDTLELPGCFAMTELANGSDVFGIQTMATYDPATQEFIINTPNNSARKAWIGGAAQTAKITTCFAQLTVNGQWQGIHVFVVRLRDDAGNHMPGVITEDHGPKQGLNGVDNGKISFHHVRIPRENLLNKYADVDSSGKYTSPISNPAQRFGTMVSGLTTGRMLIAQAAVDACKVGVTIALRYSANRPQFGNKLIIEYVTQQRLLIPALATAYAMHLSMAGCKALALGQSSSSSSSSSSSQKSVDLVKQIHILSSGLKAAATWHRVVILQNCRECCGGMGFLAANKIGPMLNDMNVDATFEGQNTVMMQQVAKSEVEMTLKQQHRSGGGGGGNSGVALPRVNATDLGLGCVAALLSWRQHSLAADVAAEVLSAQNSSSTANSGNGGAKNAAALAAAAAAVLEENMDRLVELGWAVVDASSYKTFVSEAQTGPAAWQSYLTKLALLYGLSRVENSIGSYLAAGALPGGALAPLRRKINSLCGEFAKDKARAALELCDGFGIPDHLLQAPIALRDWRDL